jgi:GTP-binding protein EngB required for normal cell division
MSKHSHFFGSLTNSLQRKRIEAHIDIIEYENEGICYAYSPALDLIGYGYSQEEARQSWETVLEEYFTYTLNKNTLMEDLQKMGWNIKKDKEHFTPPSFSWLLQNNHELTEVYDKYNFKKTSRPIQIPAYT